MAQPYERFNLCIWSAAVPGTPRVTTLLEWLHPARSCGDTGLHPPPALRASHLRRHEPNAFASITWMLASLYKCRDMLLACPGHPEDALHSFFTWGPHKNAQHFCGVYSDECDIKLTGLGARLCEDLLRGVMSVVSKAFPSLTYPFSRVKLKL